MALDVIVENEVVVCPHCGEEVVLCISTNVYGISDITVDEEMSNRKPIKFDYRGRVKRRIL